MGNRTYDSEHTLARATVGNSKETRRLAVRKLAQRAVDARDFLELADAFGLDPGEARP